AARSDLGYSPYQPFQPQESSMMFSTCRAQSSCSGLPTSLTHFNVQSAVTEGRLAPVSRSRHMQYALVWLAVIVAMLWPVSLSAQYTDTTLYSFCALSCTDGDGPDTGALVFDSQGNLYGTTHGGGNANYGVVFKLTPPPGGNGPWTETVLYSFCSLANCSDGAGPSAGVIFDANGNLYGTTQDGGSGPGYGVVYKLSPPVGGNGPWTETVLHSFCNVFPCADGSNPTAGLIFDSQGNLYSTTSSGGSSSGSAEGTVFKLSPNGDGSWTEAVLHTFCLQSGCPDGSVPGLGSLIFDTTGNLYGTTLGGGNGNNAGVVFELTPSGGSWTESVLYFFCSLSNCVDGLEPKAGLIFDSHGNLYGNTLGGGGMPGYGVAFELSPSGGGTWTENVLQTFCAAGCP